MPKVLEISQEKHVLKNIENSNDLIAPRPFSGHTSHIRTKLETLTSTTSATLGSTLHFDLPLGGLVGECFLATTLADATANYDSYPGLNLIEHVEVVQGDDLEEFDYQPVMATILSKLPDKAERQILSLSGGTAFDSGVVVSPIPVFWSKLNDYSNKDHRPLDLRACSQKVTLKIKLRPASAVEVTPDGSISSCKLYYQDVSTDSPVNMEYPCTTWQSLESLRSAAVTATSYTDPLSLVGAITEIHFTNRLVSDITARDRFFNQNDLDNLQLLIDGQRMNNIEEKESASYVNLISAHMGGSTSTVGDPQGIVFQFYNDHPLVHSGSLHMADVSNLQVAYKSVAGANSTVGYAARSHTMMRVEQGRYRKYYQ